MFRPWVWIMAIGLVLADGWWKLEAAGVAYDLTKLKSICVKAVTGVHASDFGLNNETIGNHVYVWLKGKLPKLQVERYTGTDKGACAGGAPVLYANVNIISFRDREAYFGDVALDLHRETVWKTGNDGWGIAYSVGQLIQGSKAGVWRHVNERLDDLLTDFAAEYYKAGNP